MKLSQEYGMGDRFLSDNGKQFMSRDFKELLSIHGFTHVSASRFYPQSNGKIE
jgi:transposase InsO family protein